MLKHLHHFLKFIIFSAFGIGLFFAAQSVFQPAWNYPRVPESTGLSLKGFDRQEENVDEVLFLGTSHSVYGISPMLMYEQNGIISWNLSSSGQPMGMSYYLLKHALKTQSPKLVVLDVSSLANYSDNNAFWRYILDNVELDADKIAMSADYEDMMKQDYAKLLKKAAEYDVHASGHGMQQSSADILAAQEAYDLETANAGMASSAQGTSQADDSCALVEKSSTALSDNDFHEILKAIVSQDGRVFTDSGYFWSGLFSMLQYHSRWKELSSESFKDTIVKEDLYSNGYYLNPVIGPADSSLESADEFAVRFGKDTLQQDLIYEHGAARTNEAVSELYAPAIAPEADAWLKRIAALCNEAGAQLLLIKVPVNQYIIGYTGAWNSIKYKLIKDYAASNGFNYLDLMYDADVGIDWSADTIDGGTHLNYLGAEKLSSYLGAYLADTYGLGGKENASMDSKTVTYDKLAALAELETDTDTLSYLNRLIADKDKYIICMAVNNDYLSKLPADVAEALSAFGLNAAASCHDDHDAYVAYIDAGNVVYEQLSNRPIYWHSLERGVTDIDVSIESSGMYTGSRAFISLNGRNLAADVRGLNIVVIDKATQLPLDSVLSDALSDPYSCSHYYASDFNPGYWLSTED